MQRAEAGRARSHTRREAPVRVRRFHRTAQSKALLGPACPWSQHPHHRRYLSQASSSIARDGPQIGSTRPSQARKPRHAPRRRSSLTSGWPSSTRARDHRPGGHVEASSRRSRKRHRLSSRRAVDLPVSADLGGRLELDLRPLDIRDRSRLNLSRNGSGSDLPSAWPTSGSASISTTTNTTSAPPPSPRLSASLAPLRPPRSPRPDCWFDLRICTCRVPPRRPASPGLRRRWLVGEDDHRPAGQVAQVRRSRVRDYDQTHGVQNSLDELRR